jgi:hypothetical protein
MQAAWLAPGLQSCSKPVEEVTLLALPGWQPFAQVELPTARCTVHSGVYVLLRVSNWQLHPATDDDHDATVARLTAS